MTLDDQLKALCEEHDLVSLSVSCLRRSDGTYFFASNAQCFVSGNRMGEQHIADDAVSAVTGSIAELNAKRVKLVSVPELAAA